MHDDVRIILHENKGLFRSVLSSQSLVRHEQSRGDAFTNFVLLSIYKISFFIVITTIGLNLIFGIIVDTFSELRDKKVR